MRMGLQATQPPERVCGGATPHRGNAERPIELAADLVFALEQRTKDSECSGDYTCRGFEPRRLGNQA